MAKIEFIKKQEKLLNNYSGNWHLIAICSDCNNHLAYELFGFEPKGQLKNRCIDEIMGKLKSYKFCPYCGAKIKK